MTVASNSPTPVARAEPLNQHMTCATFDKRDVPVGAPLYTTPDRAEAQDEGAAGERIEKIIKANVRSHGRGGALTFTGVENAAKVILAAHPSPTPAADADRVRIAVEALERGIKRCETYEHIRIGGRSETAKKAGTLRNAMGDMKDALAALKSTAAKEGGE